MRFDPAASLLPAPERLASPAARRATLPASTPCRAWHTTALRALGDAVESTVAPTSTPPPGTAIALKIDSAHLPIRGAATAIETWVHNIAVNGIHRAPPVARGGIPRQRSARRLPRRILGLMRTQLVKNAVIVPVGAKGGFVVKSRRAEVADRARTEAAYRLFIEALLSITDNLENTARPCRRAADRLRRRRSTWSSPPTRARRRSRHRQRDRRQAQLLARRCVRLRRAHGYDHKRLAITARGVWGRPPHFRGMGRDLGTRPSASSASAT
jgi:glutamate dehydrogenase